MISKANFWGIGSSAYTPRGKGAGPGLSTQIGDNQSQLLPLAAWDMLTTTQRRSLPYHKNTI